MPPAAGELSAPFRPSRFGERFGPKVDAACRFVRSTGKQAAIGELSQLGRILAGEAGTTISAELALITVLQRLAIRQRYTPASPGPTAASW